MKYVQGEDRNQKLIFPELLDDYISEENPVRVIDAYVNSLPLRDMEIGAHDNTTGRPPFDPKDMVKLYIYGFFNKLRSSRLLEREAGRNVELMWLLNKLVPDHKTIANFRKDNAKNLKKIFHDFVKLCKKLELYGKELAVIDGSKFSASNSLDKNFNQEKLDDRIRRIDAKIEQFLSELSENDRDEIDSVSHTSDEIKAMIAELSTRKQAYEEMKAELNRSGETQISTTDPDSRRMKRGDGASDVCYNVQTAVDAKNNMIIDYEVTNQCSDKNLLASTAISAKEALGVDELVVLADKGYFVASDIARCMVNGIIPHVSSDYESVTFCIPTSEVEACEPQDFNDQGKNIFIEERNIGLCPMGNILYPRSYRASTNVGVYSNTKACRECPHRSRCKSYDRELKVKMPRDKFTKDYNAEGLHIKQITYKADKSLLKRRKEIVEHPFGTVKRSMDASYCLTRGRTKVCGEFALTFLCYNLKRAINILGAQAMLRVIRA